MGLALVVGAAAFSSVGPWFLRGALDGIRAGAPLKSIWLLGGAMVAASLIGGAGRYMMREKINGLSRWIEYDLRNDLFRKLEEVDATYFTRMRTGDLMARLTNDLSAVRQAVGPAIMYFANTIFGGAFAIAFMLHISSRLTAVAVLPMIILPAIGLWLGRRIHARFEAVQAQFSDMTTLAQENLAGVRIVRAFRQEAAEMARWATLNDEYLDKNMGLAKLYGIMQPSFGMFAGLGMVAVAGFGGVLVIQGTISVGSYVAFGLYLGMLTWPLIALGWVINLFQRGAASTARLLDILDATSLLDVPRARVRSLPTVTAGRGIEFRNVGFHYPTEAGASPRWVLRDITFSVPAGATIGVVGATGSGKSALMDLVPRLLDPQEGEILIDGVPIRDVELTELRREIGYVPQESFLFSDTIGSNLVYGTEEGVNAEFRAEVRSAAARNNQDVNAEFRAEARGAEARNNQAVNAEFRAEVRSAEARNNHQDSGAWAARIAQLAETIESFPGGYETILGERGINLSGGQKQRAALARALARRPSIVLLDDALSAVDTHTEAEILHALHDALAGRTAMIASHRISAIRDATWIIVLDEGRIVEQGRHEDLLAAGGRYWALLSRQQLEESIEADEGDGDGDALSDALAETSTKG
ncbi:MAG TPA: ABC transporter ATP-binding protein [Gemmatimonadaceae bacterium]|nr:ABC transporter ATP-binding protein [Gemmatimonadaceae bacterium]